MKASLKLCAWALALLAALAGTAGAARAEAQQDLYLKALQSIAEGRRGDASQQLRQLIEREPMHAGAWLELALTQCSLGHADEAERIFVTIVTRFDPSIAILELIAAARAQGCNEWDPVSSTTLSLGRGSDRNVNQGASTSRYVVDAPGGLIEYELSDDFTPRRDQYTVLTGEHTREITPNGSLGFVQVQARRNDRFRQYDTGTLFAGIESPYRFGGWSLRTTGTLGLVTLGGQLYQRQAQAQARLTVPLGLPAGMQLNVSGAATYSRFPTLTNFDSVTGELRGQLSYRKADRFASASVGLLEDHAVAARPGGDRDGWYANVLLRKQVNDKLGAELAYSRQGWRSQLPYAPGLIEQARHQSTRVWRASMTYALTRNHALQLEARAVRNHENISIFQYDNRQLQLSWQWQLP